MVLDDQTSVADVDEALIYLSADRVVARTGGDLERYLTLSEEIDSLLRIRNEMAA